MNSESKRYLPILNDKQGEFGALAEVDAEIRQRITPLVDFRDPQPSKDRRTSWSASGALTDRLVDPNSGLIGCWGDTDRILVDMRRVDPRRFHGRHPADHVLSLCADVGIKAVPVTGRDRDPDYRAQVALHVPRLGNGACVRLRDSDLAAGSAGAAVLLKELDLPRSEVDLVFDLQQLQTTGTFMAAALAAKYLERFSPLSSWRSIALAGSSFPPSLGELVGYNGTRYCPGLNERSGPRCPILTKAPKWRSATMARSAPSIRLRPFADQRTSATPSINPGWYFAGFIVTRLRRPTTRDSLATSSRRTSGWPTITALAARSSPKRAADGCGGNATQYRQAGFVHHLTVSCEADA